LNPKNNKHKFDEIVLQSKINAYNNIMEFCDKPNKSIYCYFFDVLFSYRYKMAKIQISRKE